MSLGLGVSCLRLEVEGFTASGLSYLVALGCRFWH